MAACRRGGGAELAKVLPVAEAPQSEPSEAQPVRVYSSTPKAQPRKGTRHPRRAARRKGAGRHYHRRRRPSPRNSTIAKDQVPPGYRPPMSTLRFALILSLVAVGSALLTAGTYFLTTRASPPVKVVTIRVPADPAPAVAATPSPAAAIAATAASATAPPSRPPGRQQRGRRRPQRRTGQR